MKAYQERKEAHNNMSLNKFLEDNCIPCYEESDDSDADEKTDVDKFVEQHIRNGRIW